MPAHVRYLCVIAMPRTGSSQLRTVLDSHDGITAYGEVFHRHRSRSFGRAELAALRARTDTTVPLDSDDPESRRVVREHPGAAIEAMAEVSPAARVVSFNVFADHIPNPLLEAEVLSRPDLVPVVLRRRVLDCYASSLKARAVHEWKRHDTTDVVVKADVHHFVHWVRRFTAWYEFCVGAIQRQGKPIHLLTYESHVDCRPEETVATVSDVLTQHGCVLPAPPSVIESLVKQDRSESTADKIANWRTFRRQLRRRGLLDVATGYFI